MPRINECPAEIAALDHNAVDDFVIDWAGYARGRLWRDWLRDGLWGRSRLGASWATGAGSAARIPSHSIRLCTLCSIPGISEGRCCHCVLAGLEPGAFGCGPFSPEFIRHPF
jgi:hypothetical protein